MTRSVDEPSMRRARRLAGALGLLSLLLGSWAHAGAPVVHQASPAALKSGARWQIEVEQHGKDATIHIRGTHAGQPECVQKPYLKVRYNPGKARLKTRQMARIECRTTEQSATLTPKRRAFEFFINGELTAFVDLDGASRRGPAGAPIILPVDPRPKEPIFLVIPARADEPGCHTLSAAKATAAGKKVRVSYTMKPAAGCEEKQQRYQVLAPLGPLRRGRYALTAPGGVAAELGVGVPVAQAEPEGDDDEGEEPAPVARASADPAPSGGGPADEGADGGADEGDDGDEPEASDGGDEPEASDDGDKPEASDDGDEPDTTGGGDDDVLEPDGEDGQATPTAEEPTAPPEPAPARRAPKPVPGVPANIDVY